MSMRAAASPTLPLDVIYHTIDHLQGDISSLLNCSLTCHALLWYARTYLFRDIWLRTKRNEWFARLIHSNPRIGKLVRSLELYGLGTRTSPDELPHFSLLANLRSLTFDIATFESLDSFFLILAELPALEYLECRGMDARQYSDDLRYPRVTGGEVQLNSGSAPDPQPFCPNLRTLTIKHGRVDQDVLTRRLLELSVPEHLENLRISFGATDRHMHWVPVICAARETLRDLGMSMSDAKAPHTLQKFRDLDNSYAFVGDALAVCASLISLSFKHCPDTAPNHGHPSPSHFLSWLCEFFERREVPLPAIERLSLGMVDRAGSMVSVEPHLCTRLAQALLTRTRYPHLRTVVIDVRSQTYARHFGTWYNRGLEGGQKHALLARWRAAFSSFERHSEVSLQVKFTL